MTTMWYEDEDQYTEVTPWSDLAEHSGPHGVAVVQVFREKTQPGWGHERFMKNYSRSFFDPGKVPEGKPYALVMRSLRLLCVDIDGKNDGYKAAKKLELPPTLAETSKSGNGHHLLYSYPDEWDENAGYVDQPDRINMWQGIDIKSVGVVYHHLHQRWNTEAIAVLPESIGADLRRRRARDEFLTTTPSQASELSDEDLKFKRDMLLIELSRARSTGRDSSLWRIGASLLNLGVDEAYMAEKIRAAGIRWGVPLDVIDGKIIPNIISYARRA